MSDDDSEVRRFYLGGYIDNDVAGTFIAELQAADYEDPTAFWDITLNSEGGDIEPGSAVYDTLREFSERCDGTHYISIHARGQCCSMATLISQAGDWRDTTELTIWMFHDLTTEMIGKTTHIIREQCDMFDDWADVADEKMLERTTLDFKDFRKQILGTDWYVRGKPLLDMGFVDEVV